MSIWLNLCLVIVVPLAVLAIVSPTIRKELKMYFDLFSNLRAQRARNQQQQQLLDRLMQRPELLAEIEQRLEEGNEERHNE